MLSKLLRPSAFKVALALGLIFAALHFSRRTGIITAYYLDLVESKAIDVKFRWRGPLPLSHKVALAEIDDRAVQAYGLWPWNRALVAQAVQKLVDDGATAVALDMVFSDPDRNSAYDTLSGLKDKLGAPDQQLEAQLKAVLAKAPAKLKGELQPAVDAALREHARLADDRELVSHAVGKSPDAVLHDTFDADSDNVVLGTIGLDDDAIRGFDAATLEGWQRAVRGSLVTQAFVMTNHAPKPLKDKVEWTRVVRDTAVQAWLPSISSDGLHYGSFAMSGDLDGTMRRYAPLRLVDGGFFPSLAVAAVSRIGGFPPRPLQSPVEKGGLEGVAVNVGADDAIVPVDAFDGSKMLINFVGPNESWWHAPDDKGRDGKLLCEGATCDRVSMADVLSGKADPKIVKDKIVFVGVTALGDYDQRVTPFSAFGPGVYVHMNVAEDLLSGRFLTHGSELTLIECGLLLAMAILLGLLIPRLHLGAQLATVPLGLGGYLGSNVYLFNHGTQLFTVTPLIEIAAVIFGVVFFQYFTVDAEKRQVRTAFQYYLTESVMTEMLKDPSKLKLGGQKKNLTVLFSDIRGFTTLSEMLEPSEVVRRLNEYLTPMTNLVFKTGGTLDKYMGDAIMAFWGAPVDQADHALRACETAVAMLKELHALRAKWKAKGEADIDIGIGLNSGDIHVGNMGSDNRFDYTVIGDDVNLASRLEGTNKSYGTRVIIGENTYAQVKGKVVTRELGGVMVKGKKKPVTIYELRDMGAPTAQDAATIAAFEKGLVAYRARDWDGAEGCFHEVMKTWANDGPSEKYLEDIADKRAHPPDAGWDGVYVMKTK